MAADEPSMDGATGHVGAAFFDLDKTLMQGSSGLQFARAAHRTGLISRRRLLAASWANLRFRLRGATDKDSLELRERIAAGLTGRRVLDLQRLGPDVLSGVLPRLYPRMLMVAHSHQDAGRRTYITTAASRELAQLLAQVLSFDGAIGSELSEAVDGIYTGRLTGLFAYREGKANAIRALAAREGISLADSYAYTDSVSDLPMLEAVGHPVVVNPDRELAQIARERGWESMRLDRIGRRLKTGVALGGAAAAGAVATVTLTGRRA
jgi:HAD superfamily hydrolase (TIGR01490 family)